MLPHGPWQDAAFETERRQQTCRFAHVPFDGMHSKGSVRNVRNSQVLTSRQQILDAYWNQCSERDLERPAPKVKVTGAAYARVKIDSIAADAHRVREDLGPIGPEWVRDVLLEDGKLGSNTARLPDIRSLGESIRRSPDHIPSETQSSIS